MLPTVLLTPLCIYRIPCKGSQNKCMHVPQKKKKKKDPKVILHNIHRFTLNKLPGSRSKEYVFIARYLYHTSNIRDAPVLPNCLLLDAHRYSQIRMSRVRLLSLHGVKRILLNV